MALHNELGLTFTARLPNGILLVLYFFFKIQWRECGWRKTRKKCGGFTKKDNTGMRRNTGTKGEGLRLSTVSKILDQEGGPDGPRLSAQLGRGHVR